MREQLLAANHFLMGTTNLLLVELPDGWMVMDGTTGPEVDRWIQVGELRWMTQGQAQYRLFQTHPDQAQLARTHVDLTVWVRPESARPPIAPAMNVAEEGSLELAGHEARYAHGIVKRGLLPRREVPALRLALSCPETERHLLLEFAAGFRDGRPLAEPDDLQELLKGLQSGFRCH